MSVAWNVPFVKTVHKQPYAAISPSRPELSQAGKTVLVLGGSISIGLSIAKSFVQASASHVIVTGRRQTVLDNAVAELKAEAKGSGTTITGISSDMADLAATEKLWDELKHRGIVVDVLVLNGVNAGPAKPLLEAGLAPVWNAFEANYLINLSTVAIHLYEVEAKAIPTYALTKSAGTLLVQLIANDTDPSDLQVISFNPGSILSESARNVGFDETSFPWDDEKLPGHFAVWMSVVFVGVAVSYGAGRHIATIPPNDAHKAIFYTMVASPPSILAFTVPKIAVLILLVKVLCPSRRHRVFMWTIAVLVSLMSIGTMVMIWVQCQPVAVQWGEAKGTCWNPEVVFIFGLVHGVLSALFDFYLAMYPSIVLSSLHRVNWKKKLALSSALGFGYCASGVAAYKAHTLSHLLSLKDFTFAIDDVVLWTK
ncbi:588c37c8-167c-4bd2-9407-c1eed63c842f [Thermothielavioides terrestris]|uniref:588c37c8-167c-4bd2-9407-c1eed63c842f n=1 Tax=Thermothielavioides terrestris TaxID=2587410 RepID=A0A3S4AUD6_9PEZI|nr:588c37c8-167c-4bd2-9407-c1eed63c842f [Thermothielavioides terrestris]